MRTTQDSFLERMLLIEVENKDAIAILVIPLIISKMAEKGEAIRFVQGTYAGYVGWYNKARTQKKRSPYRYVIVDYDGELKATRVKKSSIRKPFKVPSPRSQIFHQDLLCSAGSPIDPTWSSHTLWHRCSNGYCNQYDVAIVVLIRQRDAI